MKLWIIALMVCIPAALSDKAALVELLEKLTNKENQMEKGLEKKVSDSDEMKREVSHELLGLFRRIVDGCKGCENSQGYKLGHFDFCTEVKKAKACSEITNMEHMCQFSCGFCTCKPEENVIGERGFDNPEDEELARTLYSGFEKMIREMK